MSEDAVSMIVALVVAPFIFGAGIMTMVIAVFWGMCAVFIGALLSPFILFFGVMLMFLDHLTKQLPDPTEIAASSDIVTAILVTWFLSVVVVSLVCTQTTTTTVDLKRQRKQKNQQ